MDENQKIIYDLLAEVRKDQKKDSEKIADTKACVTEVRSKLNQLEAHVGRNTKNLEEHMTRTAIAEQSLATLTDLHKDNQKRIKLLEEDSKKKDQALEELGFEKKS